MTDRPLGDVSHTPPHDERNPVQRRYQRGTAAVADGGDPATDASEAGLDAPADEPATDADDEDAQTLEDVDHTPPDGEGVNHVYQRGTEQE